MSISNSHEKSAASQALDAEFGILLKQNMNGFVDRQLAAELDGLRNGAHPPSNNMGGNLPDTPLFLPHGEISGESVSHQKTKIDWLGYTSEAPVEALRLGLEVLWPNVKFSRNKGGMPGYPDSQAIIVDGVQYGLLGYGATNHTRSFVSLPGTACKTLTPELLAIAHEMLVAVDARLARLDICLDFFNGERTFDHALFCYDRGDFKGTKGGVNPRRKLVGEVDGKGKNLGRTMYVGVRGGEKMARIYEKGLEVYAHLPDDLRAMSEARALVFNLEDKQFADNWLRIEIEFTRQKKERDLPLDMLIYRDKYFAGAYPYCADALGLADGLRPSTLKSDLDVDFIKMIGNAKRSYGSLVHTMKELGFTDSDVVVYLTTGTNNNKLVKSGMLAKIKEIQSEIMAADPDSDIPF